jgi:MFS family permease
VTASATERVTYREVLSIREFRALFLSQLLSLIGDQIARIALALLVYDRSGSAFAASATYGSSYFTWLIGGPFLSALADRWSRRNIMIVADVARALLVALLLVPHPALWLIFLVLGLIGLLAPPFESARSALVPDIVSTEQYPAASTLVNTSIQAAQVAGFFFGGVLVALVSARGALAIDVLTFVVSAVAIGLRIEQRPGSGTSGRLLSDIGAGFALLRQDAYLRGLLTYGVLATAVAIVPEGLAVALAAEEGRGSITAGALTASLPLGYVVASTLLLRVPSERRPRLLLRLTLLLCVPLVLTPLVGSPYLVVVLWVVAGLGTSVQLVAAVAYVAAAPPEMRGRLYGIASTALMLTQGAAVLLAGALADVTGTRAVVAGAGLTGLALLGLLRVLLPGEKLGAQGKHARRRRSSG